MPSIPNLFDWATSELSQDAFLCWLIVHAGETARVDHQRVARAFIVWLWNRSHPATPFVPADVSLCSVPMKQQGHTDVLFSARLGGTVVLFLIEDKVHTSHHGDQLVRYAEWIETQKQQHGAIAVLKIYFKTGYHFDADRAAEKHGYSVVGLEDVVAFFSEHTAASEILDDYRRYVTTMLADRRTALDGYRKLGLDFVQYEFVQALKKSCPEHIGAGRISHSKNLGGSPWTHYDIATFPKALAGLDEELFLRVDARQGDDNKRRYYLCLRQYGYVRARKKPHAPQAAIVAKLSRLEQHRITFNAVCAKVRPRLVFSTPSNDFQGANESEIGIVFFDDKDQSPAVVLQEWPAVHRALMNELRLQSGTAP